MNASAHEESGLARDPVVWLCSLLIACAIPLAFVNLGAAPFWVDESVAVLPAKQIHTDGVPTSPFDLDFMPWQLKYGLWDPATPLYRYAVAAFTWVFGFSEISTRAFSVLMGLLMLVPLFALARDLYDRKTAMLAITFLVTSPTFFIFAREARHYTLLSCLAVSTLYYLHAVTRDRSDSSQALWVVCGVAALLTQTLGYLILPVAGLYVLLNGPRRFFSRRYVPVYVAVGVVYLAVLLPFWNTLPFFHETSCENRVSGCKPNPWYYLGVLHEFLAPMVERIPKAHWHSLSLPPFLFLSGLLATSRAVFTGAMPREKGTLVLIWLAVPLALLSSREVKFDRFLFIWAMPLAALLVACGVRATLRLGWLRRAPTLAAVVLVLAVVASPQLRRSTTQVSGLPTNAGSGLALFVDESILNAPTDNWEFIQWQLDQLRERATSEDIIVTSLDDASLQYYLGRFVYGFLNSTHTDAFFLDLLRDAERRHVKLWLVDSLPYLNYCLTGDPKPRSIDCRRKYRRFYKRCKEPGDETDPTCIRLPLTDALRSR